MKNSNLKKILSTVLFVALVLMTVFAISACKKEHVHDLDTVTVEPTCTEAGSKTTTCLDPECDFEEVEVLAVIDHTYVEHDAVQPTCTESGNDAYVTCENCDYNTFNELPALGHDIQDVEAKAATCYAPGWFDHKACANEGCDYKEDFIPIQPYDHIWSEHAVQLKYTAPKCEKDGSYEFGVVCTNDKCKEVKEGSEYVEVIPATGHTAVHHEAVEPTCVKKGYDAYDSCSVCSKKLTDYVEHAALGHDYGDKVYEAKPVSCTEEGWGEYKVCQVCEHSTKKTEKPLGHSPKIVGEPVITKEPTCDEVGAYTAVLFCERCDTHLGTKDFDIPAVGHNYVVEIEKLNPTCVSDGYEAHKVCSKCGEADNLVVLPATGHTLTKYDAKAPTCTEIGYEAYEVCSVCDHNTYAELPATGHNIVNLDAVAPTCTADGLTAGQYCTKCDACTVDQVVVDALGHNYDANGVCTVCAHVVSINLSVNANGVITGMGNCTDKNVVIPEYIGGVKVVAIAENAFKNSNIESVVIPSTVETIEKGAFFGCVKLISVVIGDGVENIATNAFFGCVKLTSVTIGSGVKSIGDSAFASCVNLGTVYYTGTAAQWNAINVGLLNDELTSATRYYI